jgi:hypothetical protein
LGRWVLGAGTASSAHAGSRGRRLNAQSL